MRVCRCGDGLTRVRGVMPRCGGCWIRSARWRRNGRGVRAGMGDVERFRVTVQTFGHLDDRFGGGHARQALIQYLSSDGDRLLRGRYIEAVGSALFSSVAEAAWMTDDSAPRSAVAGLSACGQPDAQAGDALAGRAQRVPPERLVGGQLADGRQAVRRCGRQGLRRRFIPRRSGAGTAGPADTAASGRAAGMLAGRRGAIPPRRTARTAPRVPGCSALPARPRGGSPRRLPRARR